MGGKLEIVAKFPEGSVEFDNLKGFEIQWPVNPIEFCIITAGSKRRFSKVSPEEFTQAPPLLRACGNIHRRKWSKKAILCHFHSNFNH